MNDDLTENPKLANTDTYGAGWMVRVKPADPGAPATVLMPGATVGPVYEAKMVADEFAGRAA